MTATLSIHVLTLCYPTTQTLTQVKGKKHALLSPQKLNTVQVFLVIENSALAFKEISTPINPASVPKSLGLRPKPHTGLMEMKRQRAAEAPPSERSVPPGPQGMHGFSERLRGE